MPLVLYLAASTGLAWDESLPSRALRYTGLWGTGRAAQVTFLPGCLVLPLGLALLQVLTTIFRLWIGLWGWLQLQEHKGPRNHSCG